MKIYYNNRFEIIYSDQEVAYKGSSLYNTLNVYLPASLITSITSAGGSVSATFSGLLPNGRKVGETNMTGEYLAVDTTTSKYYPSETQVYLFSNNLPDRYLSVAGQLQLTIAFNIVESSTSDKAKLRTGIVLLPIHDAVVSNEDIIYVEDADEDTITDMKEEIEDLAQDVNELSESKADLNNSNQTITAKIVKAQVKTDNIESSSGLTITKSGVNAELVIIPSATCVSLAAKYITYDEDDNPVENVIPITSSIINVTTLAANNVNTSNLTLTGKLKSNLLPDTTESRNLGHANNKYKNVYAKTYNGDNANIYSGYFKTIQPLDGYSLNVGTDSNPAHNINLDNELFFRNSNNYGKIQFGNSDITNDADGFHIRTNSGVDVHFYTKNNYNYDWNVYRGSQSLIKSYKSTRANEGDEIVAPIAFFTDTLQPLYISRAYLDGNTYNNSVLTGTAKLNGKDIVTKDQMQGYAKSMSINTNTYVITLKDGSGNVLSSIDLPLEEMILNASYDNSTKKITLTLKTGQSVSFSVADLVSGLVSETYLTTNYYNKTDLDVELGKKAKATDVYMKSETYSKSEAYSKSEVNTLLTGDTTSVFSELEGVWA